MNVREWLNQTAPAERTPVLQASKTTLDYLYQLAGGHRRPSPKLAQALEAASREHTPGRVMTLSDLRPDVYGDVAA